MSNLKMRMRNNEILARRYELMGLKTIAQLAKDLGVHRDTAYGWMSGRVEPLSGNVVALCLVIGKTVEEFWTYWTWVRNRRTSQPPAHPPTTEPVPR